jgi:sulfate adenylyltransferase
MSLVLDEKSLCDLECLLDGYFSPLKTFMNQNDWRKVCESLHLESGDFFPLPVNLAVDRDTYNVGEILTLVDNTNYPIAQMMIEELYEPDIDFECINAYGTTDINHPYVSYKQTHKEKVYVSGPIKKINDIIHYDFKDFRITPSQSREYFKDNGWNTVVGFQTRNPMHRAHFELTKYALGKTNTDQAKLFLNPVVGETQSVDIDYHTRVHCYKKMIPKYEDNQVKLGLLPLAMRMAGPREACLHAVIRKNYGCTHFVVGRDHAGPSFKTVKGESFYGPYDAQELFFKYSADIGIKPIVSKMIVYNKTKTIYQSIDDVIEGDEIITLSGTEVRNRLVNNLDIPEWFSYPEIVDLLRKSHKKRGTCYYFIGLSGSGKTTFANILKTQLLEQDSSYVITILDGDIIRKNISNGLGFTKEDRSINVQRIGYVASEIVKHGGIVICANIAPYRSDRKINRDAIEKTGGKYIEIFVNTSLEVCEKRDVKGLYKLARASKIKEFTGISAPFEEPINPDIEITDESFDFRALISGL